MCYVYVRAQNVCDNTCYPRVSVRAYVHRCMNMSINMCEYAGEIDGVWERCTERTKQLYNEREERRDSIERAGPMDAEGNPTKDVLGVNFAISIKIEFLTASKHLQYNHHERSRRDNRMHFEILRSQPFWLGTTVYYMGIDLSWNVFWGLIKVYRSLNALNSKNEIIFEQIFFFWTVLTNIHTSSLLRIRM